MVRISKCTKAYVKGALLEELFVQVVSMAMVQGSMLYLLQLKGGTSQAEW